MKAFIKKKNEDKIANRSIALKKFFNLIDKQNNANEGNSEILFDTYQTEKNVTMISKLLLAKQRKRNPHPPRVKMWTDTAFGKQSDNAYC